MGIFPSAHVNSLLQCGTVDGCCCGAGIDAFTLPATSTAEAMSARTAGAEDMAARRVGGSVPALSQAVAAG